MTKVFHEDAKALGCLPANRRAPRDGPCRPDDRRLSKRSSPSGHAYVAEGHVLFDVPSMPAYGKLSKRPLDEMIAGARVEVAPYKRGADGFCFVEAFGAGEPGWDSPWGRGRPGWHIECSAMSWKYLGEIFDIHGGGIDLCFPITRTRSRKLLGLRERRHGELLDAQWPSPDRRRKMSKSLGNFVTIHELLHTDKFGGHSWPGEVLRLAILRTHYRRPVDFTVKALEEAEQTLDRWYKLLEGTSIDYSIFPRKNFMAAWTDDRNPPQRYRSFRTLFSSHRAGEL